MQSDAADDVQSEGGAAPVVVPELVEALRADLQAAPFVAEAITEVIGDVAARALHREQPLVARRMVAGRTEPVATLTACFCLGLAVTRADLDAALPTLGAAGADRLGLVGTSGQHPGDPVRARADLRPYESDGQTWWVTSDLGEMAQPGPLPVDHVLGIGGASTTLASWTPRTPVESALDLGTGCGVQSLHLAGHARRVVATDLSRRALSFAALNAALAEQTWDLREGSMLDPVAGETFDLVVSNPPFVITPRTPGVPLYEYRDGGRAGDDLVADLVRTVGLHLRPGGVAQLLGNWESTKGETWQERVGAWVDESGLDAWVVQRDVQDPAEYADLWARDGGHAPGTPGRDELVAAWLDDFAVRGVQQIGFGVITLRRPERERPPTVELTEAHGAVDTPMGPSIAAGLLARDWLASATDEDVLAQHWVCEPDVTEERHGRPGAEPQVILLRQGGGLGRAVRLDTLDTALVSVCDGELPAGTALAAISGLLDVPTDDATAQGVGLIRRLAADGLLSRRRPATDR